MIVTSLVVVALLGAFVVRAEDVDESDVVVGTAGNFESLLASNEFVLAEFYAPWCGHCKKLTKDFAAAAKQLKGQVALVKIDATIETDLAGKYEVKGYPTIKFFRTGKPIEYNGQRTAADIVAWCLKKSGPVSKELKADEVEAFAKGKAAVVGTFKSRSSEAYKTFIEAAKNAELDDFAFADVEGKSDGVELHTAFAKPQKVSGDIATFVLAHGYPLVDELPAAWERYSKKGLPLAILFIDTAADNSALLAAVTSVAEQTRDVLSFSFADGIKFKQQIERMGGNPDVVPSIAAMKLNGKANWPYTGELSADKLMAWAKGVADGSVKPHLKSEAVPTDTGAGSVRVVVGKSFDDVVVNRGDKDVLLEIYAPWCGHCKTLAPIYDELATAYADKPDLVIAKIDGTANDFDIDYRGFPTLKFFPAGGEMQDYEGGRTLDALKAFLNANAKSVGGAGAAAGDAHDEL